MIFLAFCIGFMYCAFLMLLLILSWPARRPPLPTKYHRKNRDASERHLSREVQQGILELGERDGVRYEFLGMADREDQR